MGKGGHDGSEAAMSAPTTTTATRRSGASKKTAKFTESEVAEHNKPNDAWLIVENQVYDVTKYWKRHPGSKIILSLAGCDATETFVNMGHSERAQHKVMPAFLIGELDKPVEREPLVVDFEKLTTKLRAEGMYDGKVSFFLQLQMIIFVIEVVAAVLLCTLEDSSFTRHLTSFIVGTAWGQAGFLMHDLGHQSVFKSRRLNYFWQVFVINGIMGGSAEWWNSRHTRHHAQPNHPAWDLDIRTLPLFAWNKNMSHKAPSWLVRWQAYYWALLGPPPLMIMYKIWTFHYLLFHNLVELAVTVLPIIVWYPFVRHMGFWGAFCWHLWTVVHTGNYLGWMFSLNHYMLPLHKSNSMSWTSKTAFTTQNVTGYFAGFTFWLTGGLNYQIEHHLFPTMPRHNYPVVQPQVKALFKKHKLPYNEMGFFSAINSVFAVLSRAVADETPERDGIY